MAQPNTACAFRGLQQSWVHHRIRQPGPRLFTLPAGIDIAVFGLLRERIADAETMRADLAAVAAASAAPETAAAAEASADVPRDGDGGDSPRLRAASPEPAEVGLS